MPSLGSVRQVAMTQEAATLVSQSYGEQLLPCIGEAFRMQAGLPPPMITIRPPAPSTGQSRIDKVGAMRQKGGGGGHNLRGRSLLELS